VRAVAGIEVRQVRKVFGKYEALKTVSLDVRDQEFTVLLGPSGCGKTTLLRIIAGLETETSGDIGIGERRVNGLPPRSRQLAMVFQNYAVFPHMTVFENIAFGLRMQKKAEEADIKRKVEWAAELMHIESQLPKFTGQLSGGQRQRVAVARALAVEPQVLLMDEPLSNLDALLRLQMRAELKSILQDSRTTTIYVTHDQVEAMSLADRIAIMHGGEIVQYDTPMRIYQDPATVFCGGFIGNPPMNFLPARRSDGRLEVGGSLFASPTGTSAELLMGIRPEDLRIVPQQGGGQLTGQVGVVEPLGPVTLLTVRIGEQTIRVAAEPDIAARHGDVVHLQPRTDRIRWFDAQTQKAIAA
jgi:multiple sugar transport system ATP-binding protein